MSLSPSTNTPFARFARDARRPDKGEMGGTSQSVGGSDVAGRMLECVCGAFPSSVVLGEMVEDMRVEGARGVRETEEGAKVSLRPARPVRSRES